MKENGFILEKAKSRRYLTQTITDADYVDDIGLEANIPALAESHMHNLEQAACGIGLNENTGKVVNMCFNQRRHLQTKWWFSETRGEVHQPRKQRLEFASNEIMDSYQKAISHMEVKPMR